MNPHDDEFASDVMVARLKMNAKAEVRCLPRKCRPGSEVFEPVDRQGIGNRPASLQIDLPWCFARAGKRPE